MCPVVIRQCPFIPEIVNVLWVSLRTGCRIVGVRILVHSLPEGIRRKEREAVLGSSANGNLHSVIARIDLLSLIRNIAEGRKCTNWHGQSVCHWRRVLIVQVVPHTEVTSERTDVVHLKAKVCSEFTFQSEVELVNLRCLCVCRDALRCINALQSRPVRGE